MLDVCLLGTSGMMPLPNRYLTSLMTRLNGSSLLIDCGEGTQVTIREKGWSVHDIDTICFTHYHGDHIGGLPGLLLSMGNADRTEPVTMIGPKGLVRVVSALRVIAPELPFEIKFIELSEKEETIERKGYTIEAFRVNHNVVCYGYTLKVKRSGRFDVEKAKENGIEMKYWSRLQKGETISADGRILTPDMVLGEKRKGIKVTYCTDSRPVAAIEENAKHADLFICEGMYGEKEKQGKAVEHKHMTFFEAAELAKKAEVSRFWLTHYSPSLIRPEEYMKEVRTIVSNAEAGKDRKSITLEFDKKE
jgi:ribonuclease Z